MNQIISKTKLMVITAALITAISLMGSTSYAKVYHSYIMRGQVISTENNEIYLCIGAKDGAQAGQKLDVYRIDVKGKVMGGPDLIRKKIGTIQITKIVDEHFAKATVISGEAKKNDIVELVIK